jgi:hypothetical protein
MTVAFPVMAVQDRFRDEATLVDYLAKQLIRGRLGLVLGAGICERFGLPSWPQLIERLFQTKNTTAPEGYSAEKSAEYFRAKYFSKNTVGYVNAIRKALYGGVDTSFKALRHSETLAAVAALVMASVRGNISRVITFNFDNILETYLEYHGFVTVPVFAETSWAGLADVEILHPHGFISATAAGPTSNDVILDQYSYSQTIGNEASVWRQRLLVTMCARTCLFIGLSGDDHNLDSLLVAAKARHPYSLQSTAYWGITFAEKNDAVATDAWNARGIFCKVVKNFETALPAFLFLICQRAAVFQREMS